MTPIPFKGQNTVFAKDQPEYIPLPAKVDTESPFGTVVSCWQLTWCERFKMLFGGGKVYMQLCMFKNKDGQVNPLTPSLLTTNPKDVGL